MADKTIRELIMERIEAIVLGMRDPDNPANLFWQYVVPGDIDDISQTQAPICGIDENGEVMTEAYGGASKYELSVSFAFRFQYQDGVANSKTYKYYLGQLQLAVLGNHTLSTGPDDFGLTDDIKEDGNSPAYVGQHDPQPGGTLNVIIKYRTMTHNPYKLPGT